MAVVSIPALCSGMIIVDPLAGLNVSGPLLSVPLHYDANPTKFAPVIGYLVLANMTDQWLQQHQDLTADANFHLIIGDLYSGLRRPYFESRLVQWNSQYSPAAVVVFGGTPQVVYYPAFVQRSEIQSTEEFEGTYSELGVADQKTRAGISTKDIRFPIVNTKWAAWYELRAYLLNGSVVPVNITDDPPNPWRGLRLTWWWPVWMIISVLWSTINLALCIRILCSIPFHRNLAVVVLCLEAASNFRTHFLCPL